MQNIDIVLLAKKIKIHYYSLPQIKHLCFELGVEFDDLEGNTLTDKARELVLFMKHRVRISELVEKISIDRPQVDFSKELTIPNLTQTLPDEQKKELAYLFEEWGATNQELMYWKILHNELDVLLNNIFDLFDTKVTALYKQTLREKSLMSLRNAWDEVEHRLNILLQETNDIDGFNPNQFKNLDNVYEDIRSCFENLKPCSQKPWHFWGTPIILPTNFKNWSDWWNNFAELRRKLRREIKNNMSLTDIRLRKTAEKLFKQTELIRGKRL